MNLYLEHFGLTCEPFTIAPDPAFLYPSNYHRQALAHLKYGLDREGGFILLTGEVGTGKTTLTRMLLEQVPANVRVAYILNARLDAEDVLASICHELGVSASREVPGSAVKRAIDALNQDLLATHSQGRKTLVVIEEAQNLSPDVLEVLRLLTNLETNTHKLLHILLVGQPELLELIGQQQLRQLNQRVVSRYHLQPLDRSELENYISHRLRRAGSRRSLFDNGSIAALYRLSGGVPRLVNLIAQHALIAAYSLGAPMVTAPVLKKASAEILGTDVRVDRQRPSLSFGKPLVLGSALVLMLGLVYGAGRFPGSLSPSFRESAEVVAENRADLMIASSVSTSQHTDPAATAEQLQQSPPELISNVGMPAEAANPFVDLLARLQIDTEGAIGEAEFCDEATKAGLQCGRLVDAGLGELVAVNRIGIVWLRQGVSSLRAMLVTGYQAGQVSLVDGAREIQVSDQQFGERWNGSFLYLWQPPPGYRRQVSTGAVNAPLLDWLQDRLNQLDAGSERLITGGRYTEAVRQQVTRFQQANNLMADGVLGPQTILKLNQRTGTRVPLLDGGES